MARGSENPTDAGTGLVIMANGKVIRDFSDELEGEDTNSLQKLAEQVGSYVEGVVKRRGGRKA